MKYCTSCASQLIYTIPEGDNRERFFCPSCKVVYYENPKVVAGTIPLHEGKIVLCKRAIDPQYGLWTLPAGYLENGETVLECACRETREEAGLDLNALSPYALCNITFINQIYFFYRGQVKSREFTPGSESLEVTLFPPTEIPWTELAFTVVADVLSWFCRDLEKGSFSFRVLDIELHRKC